MVIIFSSSGTLKAVGGVIKVVRLARRQALGNRSSARLWKLLAI